MWPKKLHIEKAFGELALAGFIYDISPELMEDSLLTLDAMMADWLGMGIDIGYVFPATPDDSNVDDDSGVPDTDNQAVYMNLAVTLAAARGKTLTARTLLAASRGYNRLLGAVARAAARPMPMPNTMPRGAGNKAWRCWDRFFPGDPTALRPTSDDPTT